MREEDDVERSGGRDREKSSGYTEGEEERRDEDGGEAPRCELVGVLERVGEGEGRPSEERGEMGYVAVEKERGQGRTR